MKKARKGFTLIELLVIIAILGVLAAMATISGSEAMTTAKAGNIISNLRNLSTAVYEYCNDNMYYILKSTDEMPRTQLWYYMNEGVSNDTSAEEQKLSNYYVVKDNASGTWANSNIYVGYKFPDSDTAEDKAIKQKLQTRAKEIGLYGTENATTAPDATSPTKYVATNGAIWMKAREKPRR